MYGIMQKLYDIDPGFVKLYLEYTVHVNTSGIAWADIGAAASARGVCAA